MDTEIIEIIAEQLINEFPGYHGKNMHEVAIRIYNIMLLDERPKELKVSINTLKKFLEIIE